MATTISAGTATSGAVINSDTSGILTLQSGSTPTAAVTVDASQNVGVGTTSPAAKLNVVAGDAATSTNQAIISGGRSLGGSVYGSAGSILFTNSYWTGGYGAASISGIDSGTSGGYLSFATTTNGSGQTGTPTERVRIDSSGNFLVGTTSQLIPGGIAGVANIVNTVNNGNWALALQNNATTASYGRGLGIRNVTDFNTASNEFIYCVGGTNSVKFVVYSNGGIYNVSAYNVNLSDERAKKNITLAGNYLDKLCAIPVKTFLFNDQTDTELNLGVVAQDVQAVAPELVTLDKSGRKAPDGTEYLLVYETDFKYAMLKAIQELKTLVDTQSVTITQQSADIAALKTKAGL